MCIRDRGCAELTVKNYKDWCTLSVNGQALPNSGPPAMGSSTVCVPPGTVDLVASPYSTHFELGPHPWYGTSGDQGSGDPGVYVDAGIGDAGVNSTNSTTVVVIGGSSACVWACCPFTDGTGCDLATTGNLCASTDGGGPEAGADSGATSETDSGADTGVTSGPDASADTGVTSGPDASADTGATSGPDASPDAAAESGTDAGCVSLTVKNYLTWCTLSVNGQTLVNDNGPGSTSSSTTCVPPGTIDLVASPISTAFELGPDPWHDTSGDHGSGDPGTQADLDGGVHATSSTTVVATSGSACVWACCPFTDGTGCSAGNQCP